MENEHHIDYGSFKITWRDPRAREVGARVAVTCQCICGEPLMGNGQTYSESAKCLDLRLADHVASFTRGNAYEVNRGRRSLA